MKHKPEAASNAEDVDSVVERFRRQHADIEANRHLGLYRRTRNGVHIWKAYLVYRREGFDVPENILKKIDAYAIDLCRAPNPKDKTPPDERTATALEMHTFRAGISATTRASKVEGRLQKILAVRAYNGAYPQDGITKAFKVVAQEYGVSWTAIKKLYHEWIKFEAGSKTKQTTDPRARKVQRMKR